MPTNKRPRSSASDTFNKIKIRGFRASGISSGIKKGGKPDLALILSDTDARVAGVFTRNVVKAAPVLLDMKRVRSGLSRGVVINSGNANACTGDRGHEDALAMATSVEEGLGLKAGSILVSSTGVIGVPLPVEKVRSGVPALLKGLASDGFPRAAEAIMTTDAFPKTFQARSRIGGRMVTVAGIAKGAGMICPDMATMLAYFLTDANITRGALSRSLKQAVDATFNSIVVDNDTSTNDTALVFANGQSGGEAIGPRSAGFDHFTGLLTGVALELAKLIVSDGEGATRLVEVDVRGAASRSDAHRAARTVAESYLVKTALFGGDPNWGRVLAALGRAGIRLAEDRVRISVNGVVVAKGGMDAGAETKAARAMKAPEVRLTVELGLGRHDRRVWTSDLTYDYVRINSAYRT